jgi:GT2 family glycosyltransferase
VKVSLVVVCHHSSEVLPTCVASFRSESRAAGVDPEVVVIEQSEDDRELEAARDVRPDRLLPRANRGYAAGLNAGMTDATGDLLLLANPDIRFLSGSVSALVDAAAVGAADVVGPQLVWDESGEVVLPIPDDPRPMAELGRTVRRRWPGLRSFERIAERSWRVWTGSRPMDVPSLRGPLMALRREAAVRLGPLDEEYFLYYEETDWLLRARRAGARIRLAPRARVVHRWGHATERRADLADIEARSRDRFFRRHYPRWTRALLGSLSPPVARTRDDSFELVEGPEAVPERAADVWLLSIVCQMEPAVGCLRCATLPPAACELTAAGRWYAVGARLEARKWRVFGRWTWEKR